MPYSTSTSTSTLTPAIAQAHERLYPRVIALLAQVEKLAARRSRDLVPAATLTVARELFGAARRILGREAARIAGTATADLGALAVGLGQLRAGLEAFRGGEFPLRAEAGPRRLEGRGRAAAGCVCLKPTGPQKAAPPNRDNGVEPGFRSKLYRRICERENLRYLQGYRDGQAGRPPIAPITVLDAFPKRDETYPRAFGRAYPHPTSPHWAERVTNGRGGGPGG